MSSNHKFESNKKYFTISIYTIAVILIGCVIFRFITQWSNTSKLISQLWDILFPFFMGFLIAYILNPVVAFFQRNLPMHSVDSLFWSVISLWLVLSLSVYDLSFHSYMTVFVNYPWWFPIFINRSCQSLNIIVRTAQICFLVRLPIWSRQRHYQSFLNWPTIFWPISSLCFMRLPCLLPRDYLTCLSHLLFLFIWRSINLF